MSSNGEYRLYWVALFALAIGFGAGFLVGPRRSRSVKAEPETAAHSNGTTEADAVLHGQPTVTAQVPMSTAEIAAHFRPIVGVGSASKLLNVRDRRGSIVAGAIATIRRDGSPGSPPIARAISNERGVLSIQGLEPEAVYSVDFCVPGRPDVSRTRIEKWSVRSPAEVQLPIGYTVRGIVVNRLGNALAGGLVMFSFETHPHEEGVAVGLDGTFAIPQIPAGIIRLRPEVFESGGATVDVKLPEEAERRVTLSIDIVPAVIRIVGWTEAVGSFGELLEKATNGATTRHDRGVSSKGVMAATGLDWTSMYTVWVPPRRLTDSQMVYVQDLRLSQPETVIYARYGLTITGRIVGAVEARILDVWLTGSGLVLHGAAKPDRTFELRGAPEGRWTVGVAAIRDGRRLIGESIVEAGASGVEIVLREEKN